MRKLKLLALVATLPLATPLITVCSCSSYVPNDEFTKVHEYINDRIFSICEICETGYSVFGTMWLFYHETDRTKANSDYTYYAITNNHVTSGFNELALTGASTVCFGYQDTYSAKSKNVKISNSTFVKSGDTYAGMANLYNTFSDSTASITENDNFKPLFTTYIKSKTDYPKYTNFNQYRDMTIVKVDFGNYADTDLTENRLDKLNEYGDANGNWLVNFDNYEDIISPTDNVTIYTGGFPLACMYSTENDPRYIFSDHSTKFQPMKFDNCNPNYCATMQDVVDDGNASAEAEIYWKNNTLVFDGTNTYDRNGFLFSPDWIGPKVTDKDTPFGGGASGSMTIRCTDINNESTYKVAGIYWGGMSATSGSWYFQPHFSPFELNFGKNTQGVTQNDIIGAFKSSVAFTTNTPYNYQMYSNM